MVRKKELAMVAVLTGATLFGFLGICTRYFHNDVGLSSLDTVIIRLSFGSLFILLILAIIARKDLRITLKTLPYLLLFGVFKILSDVTFFYAQTCTPLCLATLLQMTAPYYVMLVSLFLFRDRITLKKLLSLFLASCGCIIITGILTEGANGELAGILCALASGFFFGMFTVGSKYTCDKGVKPATYLFYTMLFANLFVLPFSNPTAVVEAVSTPDGFIMALLLGVGLTLIPYYLYAWSTIYLEPTQVSMISVFEIVSAATVGFLFFNEMITLLDVFGIALVMAAILFMNFKFRKDYAKRHGGRMPPRREDLQ